MKQGNFSLNAAMYYAVKKHPYYSSAIFALIPIPDEELKTMATDEHWRMFYNPTIIEEWGTAKTAGTIIHELGHLLRKHIKRAKYKVPEIGTPADAFHSYRDLTNIAMDLEINDGLLEEGVELPDFAITLDKTRKQYKAHGKNLVLAPNKLWEEYYDELLDNTDKIFIKVPNCGSCAHGEGASDPGDGGEQEKVTPAEAEQIRRSVANAVMDHAKNRGTVPGGLLRWAQEYCNPTVPWQQELNATFNQYYSTQSGMDGLSFRRPSRRQSIYKDFVLPARVKNCVSVAVIIDTSGSMSDKALGEGFAELRGVLKNMTSSDRLTVLSVDAGVHWAGKITDVSQVKLLGGGGTSMVQGFDYLTENRIKADIIIVITDGYTDWISEPISHTKIIGLFVGEQVSTHGCPDFIKQIVIGKK